MDDRLIGPTPTWRRMLVPPEQSPRYDGTLAEVFRIALVNSLLNLLTLSFYRFWAKTRLRRYLWACVSFAGDRFEYAGRALELLVGFLIALLILVPLGLAAAATDYLLVDDPDLADVSSLVQSLLILFLIQVAIYRARRYRLTRTQWRGIRGGQSGSALAYAFLALGWLVVTFVTLGLAYPVQRTRVQNYRARNTWFGNQRFEFEAQARHLFGGWLLAWLLLLPTLGLSYLWYRAREFRYFAYQTRWGGLGFRSELATGRVIWIGLRYGVLLLLLFAAVGMIVGTAVLELAVTLDLANGDATALGSVDLGSVLVLIAGVVVLALGSGVIRQVFYLHPMLREICATLTVVGEEDFGAVAQGEHPGPARGEGLADAFDVGSV